MGTVAASGDDVHNHPPSRAAYLKGCAHPDCRDANADYQRGRRRAQTRPDEAWLPMVPAGPARRHVLALVEGGVSLDRQAAASGVARTSLVHLVYGNPRTGQRTRRLRPDTARRLLDLTAGSANPAGRRDAGRTRALLADLAAEGFDAGTIRRELGRDPARFGPTVSNAAAVDVERLHTRLLPPDPPDPQINVDPDDIVGLWFAVPLPGRWKRQGRCEMIAGRAAFFPGRGDDASAAKRICEGCVVRAECLAYALCYPSLVGVWGGTTGEERRQMRAGRRPADDPPGEGGSSA